MSKSSILIALFPILVIACGRDSRPDKGEVSQSGTDAATVTANAVAPPSTAPTLDARASRRELAQIGFTQGAAASAPKSPDVAGDIKQGPFDNGPVAPSMMIRTGQAFIEVEKVDPAILRIRQIVAQVGGYIANSSVSGGRDQIRQATIELKVPSAKYDEAVSALSSVGKIETVTTSAQDVGEEFVDITARVDNARRLEQRLLALLAARTGKLEEVLSVERELARVREEIERYEGRLRYLSSRVAMSTLTITVHEPTPILGNNPGENPIAAAFRRAWRNFVALVAGLIASLGVMIPLAALGILGWYLYKRFGRRVNR